MCTPHSTTLGDAWLRWFKADAQHFQVRGLILTVLRRVLRGVLDITRRSYLIGATDSVLILFDELKLFPLFRDL